MTNIYMQETGHGKGGRGNGAKTGQLVNRRGKTCEARVKVDKMRHRYASSLDFEVLEIVLVNFMCRAGQKSGP